MRKSRTLLLALLSISPSQAAGAALRPPLAWAGVRTGTITTISSPVTRNVKVYGKAGVRNVNGARGTTKITTTTTTTVTTLTQRVTVIKKVTTRPSPKKRPRQKR